MNKEIKFSIKFDSQDFDRGIQQLHQKLKDVNNVVKNPGQSAGPQPGGGADSMTTKPGIESFYKSLNALRTNTESAMRNHAKEQMKLMKDLAKEEEKRAKLLSDQATLSKAKNKDLEQELKLKQQIQRSEEQISRLQGARGAGKVSFDAARGASVGGTVPVYITNWPTQIVGSISGMAGGGGGILGGFGGLGGGGGGKGMGIMGSLLGIGAGPLTALGIVKLLSSASQMVVDYNAIPSRIAEATGTAVQSTIGRGISGIFSGQFMEDLPFNAQRREATDIAQQQVNAQRMNAEIWGGVAATKSNRLSTKAFGYGQAALASLPGSSYLIGEDAQSAARGVFSSQYQKDFEAKMMKRVADVSASTFESLKASQADLQQTTADYSKKWLQNLQFQRQLGLGFETFHGEKGFRAQAIAAGFTDDMAMDSAQRILGAGGSTRTARGLSTLALQAQRGMGLTNSSEVLGKMGGFMGSPATTKEAFISLLAEGQRIGLNESDMAEEQRKFAAAASNILERSGTTDKGAIDQLLNMFGGAFQGKPSAAGIGYAADAQQQYVSASSFQQQDMAHKAMHAAQILKNPAFSGMDPITVKGLANIDMEHLTPDNQLIQSAMREYPNFPGGAQGLISTLRKAAQGSVFRRGQADDLVGNLRGQREALAKYRKQQQSDFANIPASLKMPGATPDMGEDVDTSALSKYATEEVPGFANWQPEKQRAYLNMLTAPEGDSAAMEEFKKQAQAGLEGPPKEPKDEEKTMLQFAEASGKALDFFQKLHTVITGTDFEQYVKGLDEIRTRLGLPSLQTGALSTTGGQQAAPDWLKNLGGPQWIKNISSPSPSNQGQAGTPSKEK